MRERLIELLKRWFTSKADCAEIADYLLENGVVLLPCKVGDKIYRLNSICSSVDEVTVKAIYFSEDKKYYPKSHLIIQYDFIRNRIRVNFSEIGKTVFLTREEAEAKLKGE